MQPKNLRSEMALLETQVLDLERKLDKSFAANANLEETKKIYHELKKSKERLTELTEAGKKDSASM